MREARTDEQKILQDPSLEALRDEPMALAGEPLLCVEDDYNSESDDDPGCGEPGKEGGGETKGSGTGGAALLRPSPRLGQITPGVLAQFPVRMITPVTTARALRCKINQAGSGGSRGGEGGGCRGEPPSGINGVILPNALDPAIAAIRLKVHTADPFDPVSYGDQVIRVKGIGRVIAEIVPEDRIRPGRKYDVRDATSDNGVATCAVTINGKSVSVHGSCFVMPKVPEGPVEINISAPGFADKRERRFNYAGLYNSLETDKLFLNPTMQQGEIRVTLKWKDQPKDLDLHCTTDQGDHVYVFEYVVLCTPGRPGVPLVSLFRDTTHARPPSTRNPPNMIYCCEDLLSGFNLAVVSCPYKPVCRNGVSSKNGMSSSHMGEMC